jgi:hypothetical protein
MTASAHSLRAWQPMTICTSSSCLICSSQRQPHKQAHIGYHPATPVPHSIRCCCCCCFHGCLATQRIGLNTVLTPDGAASRPQPCRILLCFPPNAAATDTVSQQQAHRPHPQLRLLLYMSHCWVSPAAAGTDAPHSSSRCVAQPRQPILMCCPPVRPQPIHHMHAGHSVKAVVPELHHTKQHARHTLHNGTNLG